MDLNQIKQILISCGSTSSRSSRFEHEGLRLKIRKDANGAHGVALPAPALPPVVRPRPALGRAGARRHGGRRGISGPETIEAEADAEIELAVVKSPIARHLLPIGRAGRALVCRGRSTVKKGQVLCIIEAMKS